MTITPPRGLGRLNSADPRDANYPLRQLLRPAAPTWNYAYWAFPYRTPLDQGNTGTCVGHGWKHNLMSAPGRAITATVEPTALTIYRECCHNDEWPGNDNEDLQFGTSVRAGAIALQKRGLITNYYWSTSLNDAVDYLLTKGPLVIGVNWYDSMFDPDSKGFLNIEPNSFVAGGHCLLAIGVNRAQRRIRLLNSWGPGWGANGRAWISFETFERLMSEDGEICAASEPPRP